jgi:hypothetical protein
MMKGGESQEVYRLANSLGNSEDSQRLASFDAESGGIEARPRDISVCKSLDKVGFLRTMHI